MSTESTESTKPAYTKPLPDLRPEGETFWAGTREHKLLLPVDADGKPFWYPRALTPGTLDQHAWIYASSVNVLDGRARGIAGDRYATYRFPSRFIGDHWNTVYANGTSAVYHR